jgi:hypothetical protein
MATPRVLLMARGTNDPGGRWLPTGGAALLVIACTVPLTLACGAQAPEPPRAGLSPRGIPTELALLARDRWEAASGLRLEVAPDLAPLEFDADLVDGALDCRTPDEIVQGRRERPCIGRTRFTHDELGQSRLMNMAIWRGARGDDCRTLNVLMHEWGHALRRDATGNHIDEPGFLMSAAQDPATPICQQIDAQSLALVCETAPCTRLNPESNARQN